jgi:hypothetical protein
MRNIIIPVAISALLGFGTVAVASDTSGLNDDAVKLTRTSSDDARGDRHDRYERKEIRRDRSHESREYGRMSRKDHDAHERREHRDRR